MVGLFQALLSPKMQCDGVCTVARPHIGFGTSVLSDRGCAAVAMDYTDVQQLPLSSHELLQFTVPISLLQLSIGCAATIACQPLPP